MEQPAAKKHTLSMPDWSQLPEELLKIISTHLEENCFDVVQARSVCTSWRSSFPFPSYLLHPSYSLPSFAKFPRKRKGFCTLKKVPLFLFRVRSPAAAAASPSEFFLGGINRDKSKHHMELLPSPLQCSVKVKIPGSVPTLMNMLDCQILPLGYQYRIIGWDPEEQTTVFLPLNKDGGEGGGEFVLLLNYSYLLLALTSAEMRWKLVMDVPNTSCTELVTFRSRFYAAFLQGEVCVIDPCSLEATSLMPSEPLCSSNYLIPSGNDELFLVEVIVPMGLTFNRFKCRVSRLDEKAGKWVVVRDLGDRVFFIGGQFGNVCCSAKELPDGCGVSGNSILFTVGPGNVTCTYKYGVHTGNEEDDLNWWRCVRENRVKIFYIKPENRTFDTEYI
ncbi:F-box domain [Arabidopsis suecica]|uniref:F-box domain n=1 Tax=Arabidopsis suecica TaxID=45249 RepID=A0A8T2AF38_ARASU|nr:F-box domain [Arabidopsis suecica]